MLILKVRECERVIERKKKKQVFFIFIFYLCAFKLILDLSMMAIIDFSVKDPLNHRFRDT